MNLDKTDLRTLVLSYASILSGAAAGGGTAAATDRGDEGGNDDADHHHCPRRRDALAPPPAFARREDHRPRPHPRGHRRAAQAPGGEVTMALGQRPRGRGEGRVFRRGGMFWIAYYCRLDGQVREVRE